MESAARTVAHLAWPIPTGQRKPVLEGGDVDEDIPTHQTGQIAPNVPTWNILTCHGTRHRPPPAELITQQGVLSATGTSLPQCAGIDDPNSYLKMSGR